MDGPACSSFFFKESECLSLTISVLKHTTLQGAKEDTPGGQLQAHCPSHCQVQYIPRSCSVPTAVLPRSEEAPRKLPTA